MIGEEEKDSSDKLENISISALFSRSFLGGPDERAFPARTHMVSFAEFLKMQGQPGVYMMHLAQKIGEGRPFLVAPERYLVANPAFFELKGVVPPLKIQAQKSQQIFSLLSSDSVPQDPETFFSISNCEKPPEITNEGPLELQETPESFRFSFCDLPEISECHFSILKESHLKHFSASFLEKCLEASFLTGCWPLSGSSLRVGSVYLLRVPMTFGDWWAEPSNYKLRKKLTRNFLRIKKTFFNVFLRLVGLKLAENLTNVKEEIIVQRGFQGEINYSKTKPRVVSFYSDKFPQFIQEPVSILKRLLCEDYGELFSVLKRELNSPSLVSDAKCILVSQPKQSGLKRILVAFCCSPEGGMGSKLECRSMKSLAKLDTLDSFIEKSIRNSPGVLIYLRGLKRLRVLLKNENPNGPVDSLTLGRVRSCLDTFKRKCKHFSARQCVLVISDEEFSQGDKTDIQVKNVFDFFFEKKKTDLGVLQKGIKEHFSKKGVDSSLVEWEDKDLLNSFKNVSYFSIKKALEKEKDCLKREPVTTKQLAGLLEKSLSASVADDRAGIPSVKWEDVGGLGTAKQEIMQTLLLPKLYPNLFNETIPPRTGLLFFGPPGTGKTLLAKAIATEFQMSFLSIKGPELLNMYVGESEKNVRDVFERAKKSAPCVIFLDELDSIAPKRGTGTDSSNVMERMVSQLNTEIDQVKRNPHAGIFLIGATNRPDLLDERLSQPGRFDKLVYLGITEDSESRLKVLKALTRRLTLDPETSLERVEKDFLPKNLTGADFYGVVSSAFMKALERKINSLEERYNKEPEKRLGFEEWVEAKAIEEGEGFVGVQIAEIDFEEAARTTKPSVTEEDLERYRELRAKYVV